MRALIILFTCLLLWAQASQAVVVSTTFSGTFTFVPLNGPPPDVVVTTPFYSVTTPFVLTINLDLAAPVTLSNEVLHTYKSAGWATLVTDFGTITASHLDLMSFSTSASIFTGATTGLNVPSEWTDMGFDFVSFDFAFQVQSAVLPNTEIPGDLSVFNAGAINGPNGGASNFVRVTATNDPNGNPRLLQSYLPAVAPVPEPTSAGLIAFALLLFLGFRHRLARG